MIYFLIPAYNESENLEGLLRNIYKNVKSHKKIIIVDDGSTDNTKSVHSVISKKFPFLLIGYPANQGAGYAFRYGFDYLIPKLNSGDLVVTMESDNTSDYDVIEKMIKLSHTHSIVLASPHRHKSGFRGVGVIRILLSTLSSFIDAQVLGVKNIRTYTSFYRVYSADILIAAKKMYKDKLITNTGFSAVIELLLKLRKIEDKIIEVPAVVDWSKRKGKSKMNLIKNARAHLSLYKDFYQGKFN